MTLAPVEAAKNSSIAALENNLPNTNSPYTISEVDPSRDTRSFGIAICASFIRFLGEVRGRSELLAKKAFNMNRCFTVWLMRLGF